MKHWTPKYRSNRNVKKNSEQKFYLQQNTFNWQYRNVGTAVPGIYEELLFAHRKENVTLTVSAKSIRRQSGYRRFLSQAEASLSRSSKRLHKTVLVYWKTNPRSTFIV